MIEVGNKATDFTLVNQDRKKITLSDYKGENVVLAFYPGAFTGGCTKEMCTIRDEIAELEDLSARIFGVSVNDPFSNKAFQERARRCMISTTRTLLGSMGIRLRNADCL